VAKSYATVKVNATTIRSTMDERVSKAFNYLARHSATSVKYSGDATHVYDSNAIKAKEQPTNRS
jgi:hypothetical protein